MINALPYILLSTALVWLYANESRRLRYLTPRAASWCAFILLFLFIGLRGHLYSDFINYFPFYESLPTIFHLNSSTMAHYLFEPGFVIYSSTIKSLGADYFTWVAIGSLLDLIVFRRFFRRYTDSAILPFLFFMAYNGLIIEFNLYRNAKAMDLFLLSIPYLERRKAIPYMLLNILGTTFHLSSVIYLPLYLFLNRRMSGTIRWGGIVFANIIFLGDIRVVSEIIGSLGLFQTMAFYDKLTSHAENSSISYGLTFGHIERTFAIILFTALYSPLTKQRQSNTIFYNCLWLYYVTFLIFHEVEVFVDRIPTLFVFGYWILYTNITSLRWRWRQVVMLIAILLAIVKITLANNTIAARYENVMFGVTDYSTRQHEVAPLLED